MSGIDDFVLQRLERDEVKLYTVGPFPLGPFPKIKLDGLLS